MNERWLPVAGYEGFYEVSDLGRVRSVDRHVLRKDGVVMHFTGRMRKQWVNHKGYFVVDMRKDGHRRTSPVHTLVLEAFVGPRPDGCECRHIDGTKSNILKNLEWSSSIQNQRDKVRHGTSNRGNERSGMAKLTPANVREIRRLRNTGMRVMDIAPLFGVNAASISAVVTGRTWWYV